MVNLSPAYIAIVGDVTVLTVGIVMGFWMMELPCYADFCIEHTYATAKHSSQIALGVFYIWVLGAIFILAGLRTKPSLHRFFHKKTGIASMSRGEIVFMLSCAALVMFNLIFYLFESDRLLNTPVYTKRNLPVPRKIAIYATQVTGKVLDVSMGVIMLITAKNSALQTLFGISFENTLRAHRWMGYLYALMAVIHTVVYIVYTAQYRKVSDLISVLFYGSKNSATHDHAPGWGEGNWMVTMGTYAVILLIPVILSSLPIVRRKFFNTFYVTHFLVFFSMVFACLHAASDFYYIIPGLGIYLVDLLLRIVALNRHTSVVKATKEPTGHVRVDFLWPEHLTKNIQGHQWVFVNAPQISKLEWHPYSLAQGSGAEIGTVFFLPKDSNVNEWENKFAQLLLNTETEVKISVDGPFGGLSFKLEQMDYLICFVSGTGLPPAISLAYQALVESSTTKVRIFWSVRQQRANEVSILQDLMVSDECSRLYCEVFYTGNMVDEKAAVVTQGRIKANELLERHMEDKEGANVGIFTCGSAQFVDSIHSQVRVFEKNHNHNVFVQNEGYHF
ncbi:hypothetical protein K7432_014573 [Basidiobolus ranarum]|uniref:FAD-binding FR-type domain-containing protein n=1 Tax=Basidiobolus ranarum TaxID=34480 RepID=A0ABR2VPC9_9FUNG